MRVDMRYKALLFLAALCLALLIFGAWWTNRQAVAVEQELEQLRQEIQAQELRLETTRQLLDEMNYLIDRLKGVVSDAKIPQPERL